MKENGKKFTLFDGLIVLLILALVGYLGRPLLTQNRTDVKTSTVRFTTEIAVAVPELEGVVHVGDIVSLIGKDRAVITDIRVEPSVKLQQDTAHGVFVLSEIPDHINLLVTAEEEGTVTDEAVSIGSSPVRVGASIALEGIGYSINGFILDVELEEAA